jgi:uncharacterized membrane protein (GlpM family)
MPQNERVTVVHGDFRLVYIFISSLWYLDYKFQLSLTLFLEILAWFTYLLDLFSISCLKIKKKLLICQF